MKDHMLCNVKSHEWPLGEAFQKRPCWDSNPGSSVYETDALPLSHKAILPNAVREAGFMRADMHRNQTIIDALVLGGDQHKFPFMTFANTHHERDGI